MKSAPQRDVIDSLLTVRDWLRYAVSRFNAAKLVYGHGTANALDEAAYLILSKLELPIDTVDPWLEARLTSHERAGLVDLIEERVTTRKPAPYLVNRAWIRGRPFYVDERVIVPRSYVGELIDNGLAGIIADPERIRFALDLCTGSGCLAILAALQFENAVVDAADISADALDVATRNVADYHLGERVNLHRSDLFSGLPNRTYDLILCNPPYVTARAMAEFPPEYRAEPVLAHAGGEDGMDLVRRVLAEAGRHLGPLGILVMEIGMGRPVIEHDYPDLPFLWLDTEESEGEVLAISGADLENDARPASPKTARRPRRK